MSDDNTELTIMARGWMRGYGTLDIAKTMGVPEAYVWNRLDLIKRIAQRLREEKQP